MKKRYAIIIEEELKHVGTQYVEELKDPTNKDELLDIVLEYTNWFTPEDDDGSEVLIKERNFNALADEIALCHGNKEPYTSNGFKYVGFLHDIYFMENIEACYQIFPKLNEFLEEAGYATKLFLNEREDDGCGWCGEEN